MIRKILRFYLGKYRFYTITGTVFLLWTLFFDASSIFAQFYLRKELASYEKDKAYYESELKRVTREKEEVLGTKQLLEKFAREKYLMKKEGETVFVIVDKNGEYLEK